MNPRFLFFGVIVSLALHGCLLVVLAMISCEPKGREPVAHTPEQPAASAETAKDVPSEREVPVAERPPAGREVPRTKGEPSATVRETPEKVRETSEAEGDRPKAKRKTVKPVPVRATERPKPESKPPAKTEIRKLVVRPDDAAESKEDAVPKPRPQYRIPRGQSQQPQQAEQDQPKLAESEIRARSDSASRKSEADVLPSPHSVSEPRQVWASYVVRRGDTLTALVRKAGCSVSEIARRNKKSVKALSQLKVGQRILLPSK